jgi:adenylate cyclase
MRASLANGSLIASARPEHLIFHGGLTFRATFDSEEWMTARLKSPGGRSFLLDEFNLIGRSEQANVRLEDPGVSRQHATIRREGGRYWVVDLGSSNGTFVNDMVVTHAQPLHDGDRLQLGTAHLVFFGTLSPGGDTAGARTLILPRQSGPVKTVPVTLVVADLVGYTAMSSALKAGDVAEVLSEWYRRCRAALARHGALIDKFIGDCVFAYWRGVDLSIRERAVEAARALRASTRLTGPVAVPLREKHGIDLQCGVGLHVGDAALGIMGSGINTALGDAVNLAFRIESLTRTLSRGVLASAAFVGEAAVLRRQFEFQGEHEVRGHPDKVTVFALAEEPPAQ